MDEKRLLGEMPERRACCAQSRRRRRLHRLRVGCGYLVAVVLLATTALVFLRSTRVTVIWETGGGTLRTGMTVLPPAVVVQERPQTHLRPPGHVGGGGSGRTTNDGAPQLVPLEAHIMSKCPDAQDCLRDLVLPTMQRVVDKVNFTLSYIGRPTGDGGVECMHGPAECMGNILELCTIDLYPDPKIYLGFTMCLSRDYPSIPDRGLVEDCALEHAVDVGALDECATRDDGAHAMDLLRASVLHSAAVGVTKSCTVRLDDAVYCIRDGGEWVDCPTGAGVNDLVVAVERLWRRRN
ncbi:gamma interferon inducible lysosomal thiol reductase [Niveomyces insectorum RCEF 264]|uniref:Gamma interferon inducible lysosomal thiol reductase n=1 Tax=Niveomyces insectorum RCEF 264 TaxID=1081102 RepID=A0A167MWR6_9HYPO|nr:gamma interferon inducible lysosomal thiol reductase [Niveomyces insectorum RCEF 264]